MGGCRMGSYLNPGSKGFQESLNSEIYVDKTGLIEKTNAVLNTRQKFLCVSRPRRFGKSMAADMLAAYYDRGEDSAPLFHSLKISNAASYQQHLNQYDVLKVNMQEFLILRVRLTCPPSIRVTANKFSTRLISHMESS